MLVKNTCFVCFLLLVGAVVSVQAQDDKKLKKEWAAKMKQMDPLEFKKLVEERDELKAKAGKTENEMAGLRSNLSAKEAELAELKKKMEETIASAPAMEKGEVDVSSNGSGDRNFAKGMVFKVQIGAFRNKDLTKYFENNKNFSGEVDQDGTKKYTLGYFRDYWEADNFKKYLREMGVKDAWIVPYKDGVRQNIKDVLEGVVK